jgi:hypothetical protein
MKNHPIPTSHPFPLHKTEGTKGNTTPYYSTGKYSKEFASVSYNSIVEFSTRIAGRSPMIVCCHFTIYALMQRLKDHQFKIQNAFKDKLTIFKTLGESQEYLNRQRDNALKIADAVYILLADDWESFLNEQFSRLETGKYGDRFFCLLDTAVHSMMLEGLIGITEQKERFYRIKFYDPHYTVRTQTYESTCQKTLFEKFSRDFLTEGTQNGIEPEGVVAAVYQANNHWQLKKHIVMRFQLEAKHIMDSQVFLIAALSGLVPVVKAILDHISGNFPSTENIKPEVKNAISEIFRLKNGEGKTALFLAMDRDHPDIVSLLIDWVMSREELKNEVFVFLQAQHIFTYQRKGETKKGECSALYAALVAESNQSIVPFIQGCQQALATGKITVEQLVTLLSAKDQAGTPALNVALYSGHDRSVAAFMHAVIEKLDLPNSVITTLFSAEDHDKDPGLGWALQKGQTSSVVVFVQACQQALAKGKIDISNLITLLEAKDRIMRPGLVRALMAQLSEAGQEKMIATFMKAVDAIPQLTVQHKAELFLKEQILMAASSGLTTIVKDILDHLTRAFPSEKRLNPEIKKVIWQLLSAKSEEGKTALFLAMDQDYPEIVSLLIDWVMKREELKNEVFDFLQAQHIFTYQRKGETKKGECSALYAALMTESNQSIIPFIQGCQQALTKGKITIEQLATLLSAKDQAGTSALNVALYSGYDRNIAAFMYAVIKELDLPSHIVTDLFLAEDHDKDPGLGWALQKGQTSSVVTFVQACQQALARGKIDIGEIITLLEAKDRIMRPGLVRGLVARLSESKQKKTIAAFIKAVDAIPQLTAQHKAEIFLEKMIDELTEWALVDKSHFKRYTFFMSERIACKNKTAA